MIEELSGLHQDRASLVTPGNGTLHPAGPVLYWMHRDHRVRDNWGLQYAQQTALRHKAPLAVVHCLAPAFLQAAPVHFAFLRAGLREMEQDLDALHIPLVGLSGNPGTEVARFANEVGASVIFTDFDPLRIKRGWMQEAAKGCACPLVEVDSRNIVPCRKASDKREYMARTIRPKVMRGLMHYLEATPAPLPHPHAWDTSLPRHAARPSVALPEHFPAPGEAAALQALEHFIDKRLPVYEKRNDPNANAVSGLSPYLHFGMLSSQRAVLAASGRPGQRPKSAPPTEAVDEFIEQVVVRRELSDNYCLHTPHYDSLAGAPEWAVRSLDKHRDDPRDAIYTCDQFEQARTHDPLWNAAQQELLHTGRIHGYMRMYWGKKILEWSATPEDAFQTAVTLNDRHALDGRDSNGYTGIAWCIAGQHDRPWKERPVYGQIRYMNDRGARRKFDTTAYIERMAELG